MKRKITFFDGICFVALISMLFSVGFHIGKDEEQRERCQVIVSVKAVKSKNIFPGAQELRIDGKYDCAVMDFDGEYVKLLCSGEYTDAGFLLSGGKYISKNQPLEAIGKNEYFYGRIYSIEEYSSEPETAGISQLRTDFE